MPWISPRANRELGAEALEPRILYSAAPVEASTPEVEEVQAEQPAAEEAPVAEPSEAELAAAQASAQQATESAEAIAAEAANEDVVVGDGEGSPISDGVNVTLVDLDTTDAGLTNETLHQVADAAAERWRASGLSDAQIAALDNVTYQIGHLPGFIMATYDGASNTITVDGNASGVGWFIDDTPGDDSEFIVGGADNALVASSSDAEGRIDLLTVLLHEQGHALGLAEAPGTVNVMEGAPGVGERVLPTAGSAAGGVPGSVTGVSFASVHGGCHRGRPGRQRCQFDRCADRRRRRQW